MKTDADIEYALEQAMQSSEASMSMHPGRPSESSARDGRNSHAASRSLKPAPVQLVRAMRHAVFPGGARVRPQLCLAVVGACKGDPSSTEAIGTATAIELLHCASLVHDDLPCFDGADLRRGIASVHKRYGEPLAVLAGDALIVLAFQTLMRGCLGPSSEAGLSQASLSAARSSAAQSSGRATSTCVIRVFGVMETVFQAIGMPRGIIAGQAWESETDIDLRAYHQAKTGALFVAATRAGALICGNDSPDWVIVGERLGEAYQIADDIRDYLYTTSELGKPAGQDHVHERPSAVRSLGLTGAEEQLRDLIEDAADAVPACAGAAGLRSLIFAQARRLMPHQHPHSKELGL